MAMLIVMRRRLKRSKLNSMGIAPSMGEAGQPLDNHSIPDPIKETDRM